MPADNKVIADPEPLPPTAGYLINSFDIQRRYSSLQQMTPVEYENNRSPNYLNSWVYVTQSMDFRNGESRSGSGGGAYRLLCVHSCDVNLLTIREFSR